VTDQALDSEGLFRDTYIRILSLPALPMRLESCPVCPYLKWCTAGPGVWRSRQGSERCFHFRSLENVSSTLPQ